MLGVLALAAIGCLLGAADPPSGVAAGAKAELLDLIRVLCTTALAITLLLGPGILWRVFGERQIGLADLPLPGLALAIITAIVAWLLAGGVNPRLTCFAVFVPLLGLLFGSLLSAGPEDLFESEEQRALLFCGLALGTAIGRTIWSLDPAGELYAGSISRTFYAEPRPDSRIPFLVPELIAHGKGPFSSASTALFAPYNFSSRGPLGGWQPRRSSSSPAESRRSNRPNSRGSPSTNRVSWPSGWR